jgi:hypothetical protein
MTEPTDEWPYDFGEFSLVPNVNAPLLLKHWPSGDVWFFALASDDTITDAPTITLGNRTGARSLKKEAQHACIEILKQVRKSCRQE